MASDSEYGEHFLSFLVPMLKKKEICLAFTEIFKSEEIIVTVRSFIRIFTHWFKVEVIVLFGDSNSIENVPVALNVYQEFQKTTFQKVWILTSLWKLSEMEYEETSKIDPSVIHKGSGEKNSLVVSGVFLKNHSLKTGGRFVLLSSDMSQPGKICQLVALPKKGRSLNFLLQLGVGFDFSQVDRSVYPSFFRINPDEFPQYVGLVQLLLHFQWNWVGLVAPEDDDGERFISSLVPMLKEKEICLAFCNLFISDNIAKLDLNALLKTLFKAEVLGVGFDFSRGDRSIYPSFFRINPSEFPQYVGLVQLLLHFQWNWVGLVAPEDDDGERFLSSLVPMLKEKEICLAFCNLFISDNIANHSLKTGGRFVLLSSDMSQPGKICQLVALPKKGRSLNFLLQLGVGFDFSQVDRSVYPSFFRINPDEFPQYVGLVQLLLHFQWNWVGLVAPEDDDGERFISSLVPMLKEKEICLAFCNLFISDNIAKLDLKALLKTLFKAEVKVPFARCGEEVPGRRGEFRGEQLGVGFDFSRGDKSIYPSFFWINPSEFPQYVGLVQLLLHFQWNWVGLVAPEDDDGERFLSSLVPMLKEKEICLAFCNLFISDNIANSVLALTSLGETKHLSFLLRINPSEFPQYVGLVQLLLHFQWNWVGLVAPEDDDGERFLSSLVPMLKEKEICLAFCNLFISDNIAKLDLYALVESLFKAERCFFIKFERFCYKGEKLVSQCHRPF
ncbi:hypothetical protein E2320_022218 [Naja naja]|nr:hypothetical protein E2320_022218 [Naja naja]